MSPGIRIPQTIRNDALTGPKGALNRNLNGTSRNAVSFHHLPSQFPLADLTKPPLTKGPIASATENTPMIRLRYVRPFVNSKKKTTGRS